MIIVHPRKSPTEGSRGWHAREVLFYPQILRFPQIFFGSSLIY